MNEKLASFKQLLDIMEELRAKCPWDKKQTIESLRYLTIEETYELADAIIDNDMDEIKGELGDLLLHIVFYAKIASERESFDIKDVLDTINAKLIRRHPHIFGDKEAKTADDVAKRWEEIKQTEGEGIRSVLAGVPKTLPSMVKATRIQEKVRGVGFDWEKKEDVFDKVIEELNELKDEIDLNDQDKIEAEFGDFLFSIINYARFLNVDPEMALERTNKKFIKRFTYIEQSAQNVGKVLKEMSLDEMNMLWEEAKKQ